MVSSEDFTKAHKEIMKAIIEDLNSKPYTTINKIREKTNHSRIVISRVIGVLLAMDVLDLDIVGRAKLIFKGKQWDRIYSLIDDSN